MGNAVLPFDGGLAFVSGANSGGSGSGLVVNASGLFSERSAYDSEAEGFAFLATDNGNLYVRQGASPGWSDGIPYVGPQGPEGPAGPAGPAGADGADGADGAGVPAGGTAGQVAEKIDGTDYNLQWVDNVTPTRTQTLTNKTLGNLRETVFTIADAAGFEINPANGPIQTVTLGGNRTPAFTNFLDGQSMKLSVNDGTAFTLTWSGGPVVWMFPLGGSAAAPTLAATGLTHIELWREGSVIYGALIGYTA